MQLLRDRSSFLMERRLIATATLNSAGTTTIPIYGDCRWGRTAMTAVYAATQDFAAATSAGAESGDSGFGRSGGHGNDAGVRA